MSAPITDHAHPIAPMRVIQYRLQRDMKTKQPLEGLQWNEKATLRVDGADDLPNVSFFSYEDDEEIGPGSTNDGLIRQEVTLTLRLNTFKDDGFYAAEVAQDSYGLIDWINLVKESIEIDDSGNPDFKLDKTLDKPFFFRTNESDITELAFSQFIEIVYEPIYFRRGTRTDTWETIDV